MKFLLLFLVLSNNCFGQILSGYAIPSGKAITTEPIDSLLRGEWYLLKTEVFKSYPSLSDTNQCASLEPVNKKITFTKDSVYNHRDTAERFYYRIEHFLYRLSYNAHLDQYDLLLFKGKKRKMHEVASYTILKCSMNELVLQSHQRLNDGMDYARLSLVYTYRKNGI
jgi:hypothetical protein